MFKNITILSGAGLSAPSGIPTFRDADGLWEGHDVQEVATPQAWRANRQLVQRFYDERRVACERVSPNSGHVALATLQHTLGPQHCVLITQNVDGLLTRAGADDVIEMHGALHRLQCSNAYHRHPIVEVQGPQVPDLRCQLCNARMRPDIVWFGEIPYHMDRIEAAVKQCDLFVSVGTSGVVYPAAGLVEFARHRGAHCLEINPVPSDSPFFHEVIAEGAETALPRLIVEWLSEA